MQEETIFYIQDKLKELQKPSRFNHTLGVMYTSAAMAMAHGVDIKKAQYAGLLHDCAKHIPNGEIADICDDIGIGLTDFERENPHLIHGKLGAYYAKMKYGVEDKEICLAIENHTRGRAAMTKLEQIVFIADFIEPNRKPFDGLENIRKEAFKSLDRCTFCVAKATFEYLKLQGKPIDMTAVDTYDYYNLLKTKERA